MQSVPDRPLRLAAAPGLIVLLAAGVALAQPPTVDALLARVFSEPNPQPYTMSAEFAADLTLNIPTGRVVVRAVGTLVESRAAVGEPRRRKATVTRLDVPLVLRPFTTSIRKVLVDLIEVEQKPQEFLPYHDVFIAEERPPDRYVLGGVRADIVTEVMTKYHQTALLRDPHARRNIARWLWSPTQRASIVRPGPGPYMLTSVVDDTGLVHAVVLAYDWGQVGNRITFVTVGGRPFWREVVTDTSSDVQGIGRVDGRMILQVTKHCLNCPTR